MTGNLVERHFERRARIQGFDTSGRSSNGDYTDHEVILLRQGFAWGAEAAIEEAARCIRELGDSQAVKPSEERSPIWVQVHVMPWSI